MKTTQSSTGSPAPTTDADSPSLHRSGAVARMLRMPVATLRVWERRYGLSQPVLTPSGQRLYSAEDIRRLTLIKQLTDVGHAIGRLAGLDMPQLQRVAATHAQALLATEAGVRAEQASAPPAPAWRLGVIGAAPQRATGAARCAAHAQAPCCAAGALRRHRPSRGRLAAHGRRCSIDTGA